MYGVILKQTGDDFVPYVQQTFPDLKAEEIWKSWSKADIGAITPYEMWRELGFCDEIEKVDKGYLNSLYIQEEFEVFAVSVKKKYKLALLSNDVSEWSRYIRERFDMNKYFDVICISGDLQMEKPDEKIFRYVIEKLECSPEECIYVDDREGNLEASKAVGMRAIMFNSRKVEYDGESVESFCELKNMLDEM